MPKNSPRLNLEGSVASSERQKTIGLIGVGRMGLPMAKRWVAAGYYVIACDANSALESAVCEIGAEWAESPAAVADRAVVIGTMVSTPEQTDAVVGGPAGLLDNALPGCCWIDFGTNGLTLIERLAQRASVRGIDVLVAPVTGGVGAATEGMLTVFVGGDAALRHRFHGLFDAIGAEVIQFDTFGKAIASKLLTNLLWFANAGVLAEAFSLGAKAGLSLGELLGVVNASSGASWVSTNSAPSLLDGNYDDTFTAELCVKDLELIAETAQMLGVELPYGSLSLAHYREAVAQFGGSEGELAVVRLAEARDNIAIVRPGRAT